MCGVLPQGGVSGQWATGNPPGYGPALYLHCHGHALNLAAGDAIKKCKYTKDVFDIAFEVAKLVKFSPK